MVDGQKTHVARLAIAYAACFALVGCKSSGSAPPSDPAKSAADLVIDEGRQTFRFETFGDEAFWGDTLQIHKAIEGSASGGTGAGVSPRVALSVGLKVDSDVLPSSLVSGIKAGTVNLDDPATTVQLLEMSAVVGVKATSNGAGGLASIGITCALCHATVDDSFPGKFDAELFLDGKAFRPDGKSAATLIPAAFGLRGVNLHTWTGWGSLTQWNAFVANLEMHGKGSYTDARLDDANRFPVAARARMGHTVNDPDLITPKLGALEFYQLALDAPAPPQGSFDAVAAARGRAVFSGPAKCAGCHVPPLYTDSGWNMHTGAEIGIDEFQSSRSPDGRYRTAPLRGLFAHTKGGFYHDGRFTTLDEVVAHYEWVLALGLSAGQQSDLVEYLKSL